MILNAIEGKTLPIYGHGRQRRDWRHVEDHYRAIVLVLEKGTPGRLYNVSGRLDRMNLEVAQALRDCLERRLSGTAHAPFRDLIVSVPDCPGHDRRYALASRGIQSQLGWSPGINFECDWKRPWPGMSKTRHELRASVPARPSTAQPERRGYFFEASN